MATELLAASQKGSAANDAVKPTSIKAGCAPMVVDGDIVDLNRICLPEDTPMIHRRFEEAEK